VSHRTDRGMWSTPNVPHKGWFCTGMEDMGDVLETCEMCQSAVIRFVHVVAHREWPNPLRVGCVCAGNMTRDLWGARRREVEFKTSIRRRENWLDGWANGKGWRESAKGNQYRKKDGYRIVIYQGRGAWFAHVQGSQFDDDGYEIEGENDRRSASKATEEEAVLAGYDLMVQMKREREYA
jgi:hypothetical protein